MEGWTWKALYNEVPFRFGKNLASSGIRTRDPVNRSRESHADASEGQKKHIDKQQGKTKHEAPHNVNYRAIQNKKNIGTTALERSVVYTIDREV